MLSESLHGPDSTSDNTFTVCTAETVLGQVGSDLSIPLGTPLLTGPGVITTTLILVRENGILITVAAAILTLFATWIALIRSSSLYKFLGEHWTNVISRIMGIILAAIAVKFITQGVLNIIFSVG